MSEVKQFGRTVTVELASVRNVPERFRYQYPHDRYAGTPHGDNASKLESLDLSKVTPDDVAAIIGNKSWTHPYCDMHGDYVSAAVVFGTEYEKRACIECLEEAVKVLLRAIKA